MLFDAGFEAAAGAFDAVVEDAVLGAVGKPLARDVARGEDGNAGRADGGGEVHGAGIVADKEARAGEGSGGFARREATTKADDRASPGGLPLRGGEVGGVGFFGGAEEQKAMVREGEGETREEIAPVVSAPILGLDFGADRDGEELLLEGVGAYGPGGRGVLFGREMEVPRGGRVELGIPQLAKVAGEA